MALCIQRYAFRRLENDLVDPGEEAHRELTEVVRSKIRLTVGSRVLPIPIEGLDILAVKSDVGSEVRAGEQVSVQVAEDVAARVTSDVFNKGSKAGWEAWFCGIRLALKEIDKRGVVFV